MSSSLSLSPVLVARTRAVYLVIFGSLSSRDCHRRVVSLVSTKDVWGHLRKYVFSETLQLLGSQAECFIELYLAVHSRTVKHDPPRTLTIPLYRVNASFTRSPHLQGRWGR
ncbi:hypothetical protein ARMGADRAFT_342189 [Armillaria gallica]|uniref:Uncharacterized protein n=1 Tax=Armillaria gallica TaxID=47427 RepID=A0A2H3D5M9_ARMGA|nr:hypothetical protein ARMGADRAFT_342189 [Armillaria gallica]